MRFAAAATLFASMAYQASAFGVRNQHVAKRSFLSTATTRLNANVLKLSEPKTQLLDAVDVFIFDCDGVIWRVRSPCRWCASASALVAHLLLFDVLGRFVD